MLVRKAHEAFGGLDILVNSAGVFVTSMVGDPAVDTAGFDRQLDINVKGVVTAVQDRRPVAQRWRPHRLDRHDQCDAFRFLVHPTTSHRRRRSRPTRVAGRAIWGRGTSPVNIVQPGAINTDMNPQDGPFAEMLRSMTALGRYGQPDDIAAAVAFLVGPDAGYITGATLNVDGGQSA